MSSGIGGRRGGLTGRSRKSGDVIGILGMNRARASSGWNWDIVVKSGSADTNGRSA
jgi:hypothetical protein